MSRAPTKPQKERDKPLGGKVPLRGSIGSGDSKPRRPSHPLPPPPASAGAASTRSRSPVYWLAMTPAAMYTGPLGEVSGTAEPGTVVLEEHRYADPFECWWISTRTEEGEPTWFCYGDNADAEHGEPSWRRVYDHRAAPETASSKKRDDDLIQCFSRSRRLPTSDPKTASSMLAALKCYSLGSDDHGLPRDVYLYSHFLDHLASPTAPETWNQRYQSLLEAAMFFPNGVNEDSLRSAQDALAVCLDEFQLRAEELVTICVEDLVKPATQQRLRRHPVHKCVFYSDDAIVLRLHQDTSEGFFQGDSRAAKVASKGFQSYKLVAFEAPRHFLSVPLMALVTFGGYTFTVSTIPPIHSDDGGLLYSPLAGGGGGADVPAAAMQFMASLGDALNLKVHKGPENATSSLPCDAQLYCGRDRRLYVLSSNRFLPPVYPLSTEGKLREGAAAASAASEESGAATKQGNSHSAAALSSFALVESLLTRIRPELLLRIDKSRGALNPDVAISSCAMTDDEMTSGELSEYIRDELITSVAETIGLHAPVTGLPLAKEACTLCGNTLDEDEVRFGVCRNRPACCCWICTHCYTQRLCEAATTQKETHDEDNDRRSAASLYADMFAAADFSDAVRCGCGARPPNGLVLSPSITTLFHRYGLNMRYLPFVLNRLPRPSAAFVKHYLEIEIVARATAHVLREKLQKAPSATDALKELEKFLVLFLQTGGADTVRFWAKTIGPEIQRTFKAVHTPFDLRACSRELLASRLCELVGVELTPESLASLSLPLPSTPSSSQSFVQIAAITPQTRMIQPFQCRSVQAAEEQTRRLREKLEQLLLFWIGYAPKHVDNALQPLYLLKEITEE